MAERPANWEAAVRSAAARPTALCLGGPHALLMLSSVCLALGEQPSTGPEVFVDHAVGLEALEIMRGTLVRSIPQASMLNPIQLLESMANDNAVAYCPLVYAYLPYQLGQNATHVLEFFDAPSGQASGLPASVLGGAGMAVTRSCSNLDGARLLSRWSTTAASNAPSTLRKEHTVCSPKCGTTTHWPAQPEAFI